MDAAQGHNEANYEPLGIEKEFRKKIDPVG